MIGLAPSLVAGLLAVSLHCTTALAAICDGSVVIRSADDAETLGRVCQVITGSVTIGPFLDNTTTQHLNFDGLEVIEGSLQDDDLTAQDHPHYTVSSSTLKSAGDVSFGLYQRDSHLTTLSLPNLTYMEYGFGLGKGAQNFTDLDITGLKTVSTLTLMAPKLKTLHNKGLESVRHMYLSSMQIDSLDNLCGRPLNISSATIEGDYPNVNSIPIGFEAAERVLVYANSSVTLGGASTTKMEIKDLILSSGVTGLEYDQNLESIEVDTLQLSSAIAVSHLDVQFDNLRSLDIRQYDTTHYVKDITLSPKAVNWTGGFKLHITGTHDLNLTSMYSGDEKGHSVQTWYWPTNISSLWIVGCNLGNPFFDTFISQQTAPLDSTPPSNLRSMVISPSRNTTNFSCAPFTELTNMDRSPEGLGDYRCHNSTDVQNGTNSILSPHMPRLFMFVGAVFGIMMLML